MIGWIFLALCCGGLSYVLATNYQGWATLIGSATGLSIEPFSGTSLFTDWITWAMTDTMGMMLVGGIAFFWLVILMNAAGHKGDLVQ